MGRSAATREETGKEAEEKEMTRTRGRAFNAPLAPCRALHLGGD